MGGKWTTYRQMGEDAVTAAVGGRTNDLPDIQLRGSFKSEEEKERKIDELKEKFSDVEDSKGKVEALFQRYGIKATEVVKGPL